MRSWGFKRCGVDGRSGLISMRGLRRGGSRAGDVVDIGQQVTGWDTSQPPP